MSETTQSPQMPPGLLDAGLLSSLQSSLAGQAGIDSLVTAAQTNSGLLDSCLAESRSVLGGNMAARDRLWLLLKAAAGLSSVSIPRDILAPHSAPPRLIDGAALLDLVVGTVRSANNQHELDNMLTALGALLNPLFLLDHAANAQQSGQTETIRTIAAAAQSALWGRSNNAPSPHAITWKDRVGFDTGAPGTTLNFSHVISQWSYLWYCLQHHVGYSEIDPFAAPYNIVSISDPNACAGATIFIYGTGFGPSGRVYFPAPSASDPAFQKYAGDGDMLVGVEAVSWTDTAIEVVVPPWAVSGDLHLNAYTRTVTPCATQDVYHLGNSVPFTGGLASVYAVNLNGQPVDLNYPIPQTFAPNDTMVLSWQASAGPTVTVTVSIEDMSGNLLANVPGVYGGGFQAAIVTIPDPGQPTTAQFVISAKSNCGSAAPLTVAFVISVIPVVQIFFIEVTQGVQTDQTTQIQGGAMPLVAGKDTGVRVYLTCDRHGWYQDKLTKITGSVVVSGGGADAIALAPLNTRPAVPDEGYIDVMVSSHEDDDFSTLNFLIPGAACNGTRTITVTIYSGSDPSGPVRVSASTPWTWISRPAIRLRWIIMNPPEYIYGLEPTLTPYLSSALDYLPSITSDVGEAWTQQFNNYYDFSTGDGWDNALDDLSGFKDCTIWDQLNPFADACSNADDGAIWVGIIPPGADASGSPELGEAQTPGDTCIVVTGRPDVVGHEVSHTFGFHHVNLAKQGQGIAGPYDTVDNGGYHRRPAFDVHAGKVILRGAGVIDNQGGTSTMAADLMSYLTPLWFTTTNWLRMFNR